MNSTIAHNLDREARNAVRGPSEHGFDDYSHSRWDTTITICCEDRESMDPTITHKLDNAIRCKTAVKHRFDDYSQPE